MIVKILIKYMYLLIIFEWKWNRNRDFYHDEYTISKSDRIESVDHTFVSGNAPSSLVFCQIK